MRTAVHDLALPHARSTHGIVTFSGGVATYVPGPRVVGWQTLVEEADAALYAAKSHGRDRVETWQPPSRPVGAMVEVVGDEPVERVSRAPVSRNRPRSATGPIPSA